MKTVRFLSISMLLMSLSMHPSQDENVNVKISQETSKFMQASKVWVTSTLDSPKFYKGLGLAGLGAVAWRRMVYPAGRSNLGVVGRAIMVIPFARWIYLEMCDLDRYVKVGGVISNPYKNDRTVVDTKEWEAYQQWKSTLVQQEKSAQTPPVPAAVQAMNPTAQSQSQEQPGQGSAKLEEQKKQDVQQ